MANITGDANNVFINDANLKVVDATKTFTTAGKVGVANTAPVHTLDVGTKVYIDEDDSVTLRVRGAMEVDGFNLASVSNDQIVFNNAGVLVGSSGLTFVQASNTLTTAGPLVAQSTASIADTLTLSKGSGNALVVDAGGAVDINSVTDISEKLTLSKSGATALEVSGAADIGDTLTLSKATGTALVVSNGAVDIDSATDISDTLTLSKGSGNALVVSAGGALVVSSGGAVDIDSATDISEKLTLSKTGTTALEVSGPVDINATADISNTLTLSKTSGVGLSVTASATVGGDLSVSGDLNVTGNVTAVNTTNLEVADPIVSFGSNVTTIIDTGFIFNRHSDEAGNVAMFYDASDTKLRLGYTNNDANETTLSTNGGVLPVEIEGSLSLNKDLTVNTDTLKVDTTNARVGINKAVPTMALDVDGDAKISSNVTVTRIFFSSA